MFTIASALLLETPRMVLSRFANAPADSPVSPMNLTIILSWSAGSAARNSSNLLAGIPIAWAKPIAEAVPNSKL